MKCGFLAAVAFAAAVSVGFSEEKAPAPLSFAVEAKFSQIIGRFSLYVPPNPGDTFTIDLAKLPIEKLEWQISKPEGSLKNGEFHLTTPLKLDRVYEHKFLTTVYLESKDTSRKLRIQISGRPPWTDGSDVRLYIYQEGYGGEIDGMAEAAGKLKAKAPDAK